MALRLVFDKVLLTKIFEGLSCIIILACVTYQVDFKSVALGNRIIKNEKRKKEKGERKEEGCLLYCGM